MDPNSIINVTMWDVLWTAGFQGLGVGLIWVPLSIVTLSTLAPHLVPDGTAFFHLLRNIGSSIHISLSVALVVRGAKVSYAGLAEHVSPYNEAFDLPWVRGQWGTESLRELGALSTEMARPSHPGRISRRPFPSSGSLRSLRFRWSSWCARPVPD